MAEAPQISGAVADASSSGGPRLTIAERVLFALSLAVFLTAFGLHLERVFGGGFAQPKAFVTSPPAGEYPVVAGLRPEVLGDGGGLEIGDRILRVGDRDMRGRGHIALDAVAVAEADALGRVPVSIVRAGETRAAELQLSRSPSTSVRGPAAALTALVSLIVLVRGRDRAHARLFFFAFMASALLHTHFYGGGYLSTVISRSAFFTLSFVAPPLVLLWALRFPPGTRPPRALYLIPILYPALVFAVRGSYFLGWPLPPSLAARMAGTVDALWLLLTLGLLVYNYRHADAIGRRRVKWLLTGVTVGMTPLMLWMTAPLINPFINPSEGLYSRYLFLPVLMMMLVPVSFLIAILRHNLFDVDRILSKAASYSILVIGLFVVLFAVVPNLSALAMSRLGLDPRLGQVLFAGVLASGVVVAQRRWGTRIESLLYPARQRLDEKAQELMTLLAQLGDPRAALGETGMRLVSLFDVEHSSAFLRNAGGFTAVWQGCAEGPSFVAASSPVVAVLRDRAAPITLRSVIGQKSSSSTPSLFDRAALAELSASAVAPIRSQDAVCAFLALGSKTSRDLFTSSEIAWLAAIAERLSVGFEREAASSASGSHPSRSARMVSRASSGAWPNLSERYLLLERLGEGGMGTVYRARDQELDREVAIKVLKEGMTSDDMARRFRREARALAAFKHAHIVSIYDVAFTEQGLPFIVMELLEGRDLAVALAQSGPLPIDLAATMLRQTSSAVQAGHDRGVLHRDLKPRNLFLMANGNPVDVRVLDFGLAKFEDDASEPTGSGAIMGTPGYLSPDRCLGRPAAQSCDLWALGVIAYELLTGVAPFGKGREAVARTIRGEALSARSLRHDLPPRVDEFFAWALAVDAAGRFSSAEELSRAFDRVLGCESGARAS